MAEADTDPAKSNVERNTGETDEQALAGELMDVHRRSAFSEHCAPACEISRLLSVNNGDDS